MIQQFPMIFNRIGDTEIVFPCPEAFHEEKGGDSAT